MNTNTVTIIKEVEQLPAPSVYISDSQVAKRYGVSRQTIWRWVKSNESFPKPVQFSPACTRWNLSQIEAWEAAR